MSFGRLVSLILLVVILAVGTLFYVQNAETVVDVVFRLPGVGAWHLENGMPLPLLIFASAGAGILVSTLYLGTLLAVRGRSVRSLETRLEAAEEELTLARRGSGRSADPDAF